MDGWNERKKERICVIGTKTKTNQFPKFVKMSTLSAEKNVFRKTRDVNFSYRKNAFHDYWENVNFQLRKLLSLEIQENANFRPTYLNQFQKCEKMSASDTTRIKFGNTKIYLNLIRNTGKCQL